MQQQQALSARDTLLNYRSEFQKQFTFGTNDHQRLEKLMLRKSWSKLTPTKQARMLRRHRAALSQAEQARTLLEQVDAKLKETT